MTENEYFGYDYFKRSINFFDNIPTPSNYKLGPGDEIIISLFVAGGDNSTITRSMFLALRDQIDPTIAAISTILIIVSSGLLILVQLLGNKDKST